MKYNLNLVFSFFILLISFFVKSQDNENIEELIVNKWSLKSFEINGQIFPPRERNKNDRMIFNLDKSAESISSDRIQKGIWSYNKISRIIKVIDYNNKFEMQLKLISICSTECILELENPKGTFVKLHMVVTE